jgi:hypothetical protein
MIAYTLKGHDLINQFICSWQVKLVWQNIYIIFHYTRPIAHYNKQLHVDPLKQEILFMAYIGKTTFNIDGTTIHSTLSIPLNCKHLPSLTSKHLDI